MHKKSKVKKSSAYKYVMYNILILQLIYILVKLFILIIWFVEFYSYTT